MEISELNLEQFKISQFNFHDVGVKKILTSIPIKKPNKQSFFRIQSNEGVPVTFETLVLEFKEGTGSDTYFVVPAIAEQIDKELIPKRIYVAIDRQNNFFLWLVKLPNHLGKLDLWNEAAHEAAKFAVNNWTRISPNMLQGTYDIHQAMGELKDPEWPKLSIEEILKIAMKGKVIDSIDHPILKKLRGDS